MMNLLIFIALGMMLASAGIVCLALASTDRPPRCTICGGHIIIGEGGSACEDCSSAWTEDSYYQ